MLFFSFILSDKPYLPQVLFGLFNDSYTFYSKKEEERGKVSNSWLGTFYYTRILDIRISGLSHDFPNDVYILIA